MEDLLDLRDSRGRLARLAGAAVVGAVATIIALVAIGTTTNSDPVGAASVGMLAIGIFVVVTAASHGAIARLHRRVKK